VTYGNVDWKVKSVAEGEYQRNSRMQSASEERSRGPIMSGPKERMTLWFANGVLLAWLVDPGVRAVTIYRRREEPVRVSGDWREGDGPVPGLRFNLAEIWRCY
jgi:hypothetical protein